MTMNELDRWMSCNPYIEHPLIIEGIQRGTIQRCGIDYRQYSEKIRIPSRVPDIKDVIFNPPATIVLWADGTKTVVKCQEDKDEYYKEVGLAMCICKKVYGNKGNYNNVFKKFIKEY